MPKVLSTFFGISENDNSVHYDYDPMHKAGLIDTHIRKTDDFKILTEVTEIIGDVFKPFNWGKNYEELTDTCGSLGQIIASPVMYSATRLANSVRSAYMNFRKDFTAIIQCMERTKTEMRDGNSREMQKATEAEKPMRSIHNVKFVLTLSGLIDIYDKYGELINAVQIVNSLPHER